VPRAAKRGDSLVIAQVAAFNLFAAALLAIDAPHSEVWLAPLWPVLFLAAGVTTAVFATRPRSMELLAWSGTLSGVAYLSRAGVVIVAAAQGHTTATGARALLGAGLWTAFGLVTRYLWLHILKPAAGDRRGRPRA
jgi:hypothetical protein